MVTRHWCTQERQEGEVGDTHRRRYRRQEQEPTVPKHVLGEFKRREPGFVDGKQGPDSQQRADTPPHVRESGQCATYATVGFSRARRKRQCESKGRRGNRCSNKGCVRQDQPRSANIGRCRLKLRM